MTENKRWALTFDDKIVDNKYNITHNVHSGYDVAFSFMNILNDYEDECNVLKDQNEQLKKDNKILLKHCEKHGIIVPMNYERYKEYMNDD